MPDDLQVAVQRGNAELGRSGLVVLSVGNLSAVDRERGVVAIKPSGIAYTDRRAGAAAALGVPD